MSFILPHLSPVVKHGPFTGLVFSPEIEKCSSLQAKILGTYEKELEDVIYRLLKKDYETIFNVGCAEGYYAIGFAMHSLKCHVYAFDIDAKQRMHFQTMSSLNYVCDRVEVHGEFTKDFLNKIQTSTKKLFICDCEGAELDIIDKDFICNQNMDFLIETHDFIGKPITQTLKDLFLENGYKVVQINSISDDDRATMFYVPELIAYDFEQKRDIIKEYRPCTMSWLYCTKN